MRTMFDGIIPDEVAGGAALYAAYLDGEWPDFSALSARFPGAVHVSIAVSAGYNAGVVLDVELGDATAAESVDWVLMRRAAGTDPTVYCSMSTWPEVQAAFRARKVAEPHYWIADYSLGAHPAIPAGAIALQYADLGGYDISVVADHWPGVDPEPATHQEDQMFLFTVAANPANPADQPGIWALAGGAYFHVVSMPNLTAFKAVATAQVPITYEQHEVILAASTPGPAGSAPTAKQTAQATEAAIGSALTTAAGTP